MKCIQARCLMCGKSYQLGESDKDFKKLNEKVGDSGQVASFICDFCSNRVRFEADEQRKDKKPM